MAIPPEIRTNVDFLVVLQDPKEQRMNALAEALFKDEHHLASVKAIIASQQDARALAIWRVKWSSRDVCRSALFDSRETAQAFARQLEDDLACVDPLEVSVAPAVVRDCATVTAEDKLAFEEAQEGRDIEDCMAARGYRRGF